MRRIMTKKRKHGNGAQNGAKTSLVQQQNNGSATPLVEEGNGGTRNEKRSVDLPEATDSTNDATAQTVAKTAEKTTDCATDRQVQQIVDEIVATPTPKRVWEVDFLRGFMILFVVWDHFMYDVRYSVGSYNTGFFNWLFKLSQNYYSGALRAATHDVFVTMFVLTSGVSCSFSRNNGKRALKMVVFALLFSAVTYAVSSIIRQNVTIYFNVIHVIALSVAIWAFVECVWKKCVKNWQKNLFGVVMAVVTITALVVGACANVSPWTNENPLWFFLAQHKFTPSYTHFTGGDYLPFLPDFGWFLVGAFLGKMLYKQRQSLFPSVNEKWVAPVTFCGRYSIWIYFGSQVVMYGFFYLFGVLWNLL